MNTQCPARSARLIARFVSREAMDIEGLGEKGIDSLADLGLLRDVSDIYTLHTSRIALNRADGWGERSVGQLLANIEASKQQPASEWRDLLPLAAGTGRNLEPDRLDWLWETGQRGRPCARSGPLGSNLRRGVQPINRSRPTRSQSRGTLGRARALGSER